MEITETKISLVNKPNSRLRAYASVTFDNSFVVREIRVIEGKNGLFVAMPSRKLQHPCEKCGFKNPINYKFCGQCGAVIPTPKMETSKNSEEIKHKDLAHPINAQFREYLQKKILEAYEHQKANMPAE
jgi:stage V sporulation protein G